MASTTTAPAVHRWAALAAAVLTLFMTLLDISIVIVALPTIRSGLHASASQAQWVVSAYSMAFGVVPVIAGRLGDDFGRKRMLLIGAVAFVVTSAASGFAPTIGVLLVSRVLQGLAGGLLNPQVSGLVQHLFAPPDRGRAFGFIGLAIAVGTAAGPVVGGLIIAAGGDTWGWRLCFLVNLPVGILAVTACAKLVPTPPRRQPASHRVDLIGAVMIALGLVALLYPFVEFDAGHDWALAALFVPAAVLLVGFWCWEKGPAARAGHPLVDVGLFRLPSFRDGVVLAGLYFVAYTGTTLVLSLFLQEGLGFSALQAGLTATSFAAGTAVASTIAGRLVGRLGPRLLLGALVLFVVGVGGSAAVTATLSGSVPTTTVAWCLLAPLFVAGLGGGAVVTPNQTLTLAQVDPRDGSTAGGTLQTAQRVGSAISTAVVSAVFYAGVSSAPGGTGAAHQLAYGRACAVALGVSVVFTLAALVVGARDRRDASAR